MGAIHRTMGTDYSVGAGCCRGAVERYNASSMNNWLRLISLLLLPGLVPQNYCYPLAEDDVVSADPGEGAPDASKTCPAPNCSGLDCQCGSEAPEQGTGQPQQGTGRPAAFCSLDASKRAEDLCKHDPAATAIRIVIQGCSRHAATRTVRGGQAPFHLEQLCAALAFCIRRHGPPGPAEPNSEFQTSLMS